MVIRKIIKIDEEKCDGCGLCVPACAEGAIQIIDGKAKLVSETYCDGLGACLGECPQGAITIEEREAASFNETAVKQHLAKLNQSKPSSEPLPTTISDPLPCGCPGSAMQQFDVTGAGKPQGGSQPVMPSQLGHWPIQLMLVPPHAPFLKNANLLVCADCVPFTVPDFHFRYLTSRAVLVGCPKLDDLQHYYEKLKAIYQEATPRSITVLKMEVPCCNGIAQVALQSRNEVASHVPIEVHTIGIRGDIEHETVPSEAVA